MKIPLFLFLLLIIAGAMLVYTAYLAGIEIGKRSIILNPKGTINDLLTDMRHLHR